jgi:hypothetical protein
MRLTDRLPLFARTVSRRLAPKLYAPTWNAEHYPPDAQAASLPRHCGCVTGNRTSGGTSAKHQGTLEYRVSQMTAGEWRVRLLELAGRRGPWSTTRMNLAGVWRLNSNASDYEEQEAEGRFNASS